MATPDVSRLALSASQRAVELVRPWALLVLYVAVSESSHALLALPLAVATCLAGFVQMHDAIHESLGLSKRGHSVVLTLSAQLLLKSGAALKATHLRHHGKCLGADDPEGAPAHWSLTRVLFEGPFHILALRREALRIAPRLARRQVAETLATIAVLAVAVTAYFAWGSVTGVAYWAIAALVSAAMPLWASYIPHRLAPLTPAIRAAARASRFWTPVLTSFAYHHVHHAHPRVPTALLPEVGRIRGDHGAHVHACLPPE